MIDRKTKEEDYIPYGPEWEKEMMKHPKVFLIEMIRKIKQEPLERRSAAIGFAEWKDANYFEITPGFYSKRPRKFEAVSTGYTTAELYDGQYQEYLKSNP